MRTLFVFFITRLLCLQNFKTLFSLYGLPLVSVMCSCRKYPPLPTEGNGNSEGRRGCRKGGNYRGNRGLLTLRGLFLGGLSKIGELLLNSSFSVEKAYISYFTVTGVSKQPLLFALIIFFLGSAKCFFQ